MGRRRKTREVALQFLYQLDLHSEDDPGRHEAEFWSRHPVDEETHLFGDALVRGTKANQAKIDQIISQFAEHWDLERMAVVDRNQNPQGLRDRNSRYDHFPSSWPVRVALPPVVAIPGFDWTVRLP